MSNVGVINDSDCDFGHVSTAPHDADKTSNQLKPSEKLPPEKIAHLTPEHRRELLEILDRYPECFSDHPGYCDVMDHEIKLKPNFTPKQSKAYRIPKILKPEVERQIERWLSCSIKKSNVESNVMRFKEKSRHSPCV